MINENAPSPYDTPGDTIIAINPDTGKQWNDIEDSSTEATSYFKDQRDLNKTDNKLWRELIKVGKEIERGVLLPDGTLDPVHDMPYPMISVIVETLRYYGLDDSHCKLAYWDLQTAKYRIWDWLGMIYNGRLDATGITFKGIEKLVKLYVLQKDVGVFCWFLRGHDLDVEEPRRCEDCIESYKSWMKEMKDAGKDPNKFK